MPPHRPLLQRVPDGRRADAPLFEEAMPVFLALMLGPLVATATAVWNLALVRRFGLATAALALGVLGSSGCTALLVLASTALPGSLAFFAAQLAAVGVGAALFVLQRRVVRGHRLMGGGFVPSHTLVLAAFGAMMVASDLVWKLHHPLLALLRSAS